MTDVLIKPLSHSLRLQTNRGLPHSVDWILTLPIFGCGLILSDDAVHG